MSYVRSLGGFSGVLYEKSKLAELNKFILITLNDDAQDYLIDFLGEILRNSSMEENSRKIIHLFNFAHDFSSLKSSNIHVYNFKENKIKDLEHLIGAVKKNSLDSIYSNLFLIDNVSLFSISLGIGFDQIKLFFRAVQKINNGKIIGFLTPIPSILNQKEIESIYLEASAILSIKNLNQHHFSCCTLSNTSSKIRTENSKFCIVDKKRSDGSHGFLIEEEIFDILGNSTNPKLSTHNQQSLLENLTTFKLTVNENEKKQRKKLYLPYFDAQSKEVVDCSESYDLDDEDDEEI